MNSTPLPGGSKPPSDLPGSIADLRASGWESVPVAEEMRRNTAKLIAAGDTLVPGVLGFEDTVVPQLENAILAGHDIILLGERGQAKTRVIRSMVGLLDEWMPIVAGSEINDDPYHPVSRYARELVAALKEESGLSNISRSRFSCHSSSCQSSDTAASSHPLTQSCRGAGGSGQCRLGLTPE